MVVRAVRAVPAPVARPTVGVRRGPMPAVAVRLVVVRAVQAAVPAVATRPTVPARAARAEAPLAAQRALCVRAARARSLVRQAATGATAVMIARRVPVAPAPRERVVRRAVARVVTRERRRGSAPTASSAVSRPVPLVRADRIALGPTTIGRRGRRETASVPSAAARTATARAAVVSTVPAVVMDVVMDAVMLARQVTARTVPAVAAVRIVAGLIVMAQTVALPSR